MTLIMLARWRIILSGKSTPRAYFTGIICLMLSFIRISFPLRKAFKYTIPNDAFILEHFNFWLGIITLVILAASFYGRYEDLMCEGHSRLKFYLIINLILVLLVVGSNKIVYFFIIFELSIIPIFLVITGWGYQPEKIRAAYALFFFTAVSAGPLLITLIMSFYQNINLEVNFLSLFNVNRFYTSVQRWLLLIGFLVKLPVYGAHLWLPLAHVEAPVYGSIILAGILLKLGGIGMLRFSKFLHASPFVDWVLVVRLLGMALVAGTCLFVTDLKKIIAFSSVSHIGFSILLISFRIKNPLWVAFLILIVHAFSSSAMFFAVYYFYLYSNSRNLVINIGIIRLSPVISFFWLLAIIASLGGPPAINLLAEIWAFMFSFIFLPSYVLLLAVSFILGRVYHFILYRTIIQGTRLWEAYQENQTRTSIRLIFICLYHSVLSCFTIILARRFII